MTILLHYFAQNMEINFFLFVRFIKIFYVALNLLFDIIVFLLELRTLLKEFTVVLSFAVQVSLVVEFG